MASCREDSYFAGLPISIIESWYQRDGYVKSMADLIEKELSIFSNPEEVWPFPFPSIFLPTVSHLWIADCEHNHSIPFLVEISLGIQFDIVLVFACGQNSTLDTSLILSTTNFQYHCLFNYVWVRCDNHIRETKLFNANYF